MTQEQAEAIAEKIVARIFTVKFEAKTCGYEKQADLATKLMRFSLRADIAAVLMEEWYG